MDFAEERRGNEDRRSTTPRAIAIHKELVAHKGCVTLILCVTYPAELGLDDVGLVELDPAPLFDILGDKGTSKCSRLQTEVGLNPDCDSIAEVFDVASVEGERTTRAEEDDSAVINVVAVRLYAPALVHGGIRWEALFEGVGMSCGVEDGNLEHASVERGVGILPRADGAS